MKYEINEKQLTVYGVEDFDLEASCECGQSFRWRKLDGKIHGIVGDKSVTSHSTRVSSLSPHADRTTPPFG